MDMEKSAKDLAFDKERIKYSRMIRAAEQEAQNREKDDWIERLLHYMDFGLLPDEAFKIDSEYAKEGSR